MRYALAALALSPFVEGCVDSCTPATVQVEEGKREGSLNRVETPKTRSAEDYFKDFPEKIRGASRIDKYWTEGARHILVHIRQAHTSSAPAMYFEAKRQNPDYTDEELMKKVEEFRKDVHEFQFNIVTIYADLMRRYSLRFIYPEGLSVDGALFERRVLDILRDREDGNVLEDVERSIEALERELKDEGAIRRRFSDPRQTEGYKTFLRANKEDLERQRPDLERRVEIENSVLQLWEGMGAAGKVAFIDDVDLRPIEERPIDISELPDMLADFSIFDGREDFALQKLAEYGDPISLVQFGGAHAWGGKESCGDGYSLKGRPSSKDNIAEWNKQHPDKKFALIEILPEGYEDIGKKY